MTNRQGDQSEHDARQDLPAEAIERLRQLEGGDGVAPLFTSDLSVNELAYPGGQAIHF